MRGHESIIAMRQKGFKPAYVWLQDTGLAPTDNCITITKQENPQGLDLRCVIGVTVIAESDDPTRLECLAKAALNAKAARILSTLYHPSHDGRFDVLAVSDSEGVMTWPK